MDRGTDGGSCSFEASEVSGRQGGLEAVRDFAARVSVQHGWTVRGRKW